MAPSPSTAELRGRPARRAAARSRASGSANSALDSRLSSARGTLHTQLAECSPPPSSRLLRCADSSRDASLERDNPLPAPLSGAAESLHGSVASLSPSSPLMFQEEIVLLAQLPATAWSQRAIHEDREESGEALAADLRVASAGRESPSSSFMPHPEDLSDAGGGGWRDRGLGGGSYSPQHASEREDGLLGASSPSTRRGFDYLRSWTSRGRSQSRQEEGYESLRGRFSGSLSRFYTRASVSVSSAPEGAGRRGPLDLFTGSRRFFRSFSRSSFANLASGRDSLVPNDGGGYASGSSLPIRLRETQSKPPRNLAEPYVFPATSPTGAGDCGGTDPAAQTLTNNLRASMRQASLLLQPRQATRPAPLYPAAPSPASRAPSNGPEPPGARAASPPGFSAPAAATRPGQRFAAPVWGEGLGRAAAARGGGDTEAGARRGSGWRAARQDSPQGAKRSARSSSSPPQPGPFPAAEQQAPHRGGCRQRRSAQSVQRMAGPRGEERRSSWLFPPGRRRQTDSGGRASAAAGAPPLWWMGCRRNCAEGEDGSESVRSDARGGGGAARRRTQSLVHRDSWWGMGGGDGDGLAGKRGQGSVLERTLEHVKEMAALELEDDLGVMLGKRRDATWNSERTGRCLSLLSCLGQITLRSDVIRQRRTGRRLFHMASLIACGVLDDPEWMDALTDVKKHRAAKGEAQSGFKRALVLRENTYHGLLCFMVTLGVLFCAVGAGIIVGMIMTSSMLSPSVALLRIAFSLPQSQQPPPHPDPSVYAAAAGDAVSPDGIAFHTRGFAGKVPLKRLHRSLETATALDSLVLLVPPAAAEKGDVAAVLTGGFLATLAIHNQGIEANFSALLEMSYLPATEIGASSSEVCFTPKNTAFPSRSSPAARTLSARDAALRTSAFSSAAPPPPASSLAYFWRLASVEPRVARTALQTREVKQERGAEVSYCEAVWESFGSSSFLIPLDIQQRTPAQLESGAPVLRHVILDPVLSRLLHALVDYAPNADATKRDAAARSSFAAAAEGAPPRGAPSSRRHWLGDASSSIPPSSSASTGAYSEEGDLRAGSLFKNMASRGDQAYALTVTPSVDWVGLSSGYNEVTFAVNLNRRISTSEKSFLEAIKRDCGTSKRVYLSLALKGVVTNTALQTGDERNWMTLSFTLPCVQVEGNDPRARPKTAARAGSPESAATGARTRTQRHLQSWRPRQAVEASGGSAPAASRRGGSQSSRVTGGAAPAAAGSCEEDSATAKPLGAAAVDKGAASGALAAGGGVVDKNAWPPRYFLYDSVLGKEGLERYRGVLADTLLRWVRRNPVCKMVVDRLAKEAWTPLKESTVIQ
ncbi:hypothetical protein BESB_076940 [Besnoitia besnoiti]|uniref:Uncharacterized protein n=1 Tax=Besnoitia besnoiti TaxID=94643 RepID=A0A2A9MCZ9_BESBE|nr:hypothetical protein BESB_076940 [Besnoitia besnoiti]PFH33477.1 hypothetical protein BESB_076940 [Besnoitia besnoiti]